MHLVRRLRVAQHMIRSGPGVASTGTRLFGVAELTFSFLGEVSVLGADSSCEPFRTGSFFAEASFAYHHFHLCHYTSKNIVNYFLNHYCTSPLESLYQ